MEKFNQVLHASKINTKYVNLLALYEFCGDDLIKFIKMSDNERTEKMTSVYKKYKNNMLILSFFRNQHHNCSSPYKIVYDEHKYKTLSALVLDLNNREIFIQALKFFWTKILFF